MAPRLEEYADSGVRRQPGLTARDLVEEMSCAVVGRRQPLDPDPRPLPSRAQILDEIAQQAHSPGEQVPPFGDHDQP